MEFIKANKFKHQRYVKNSESDKLFKNIITSTMKNACDRDKSHESLLTSEKEPSFKL